MKKELNINNKKINYKIRESNRARRLRLAVYCDGTVIATKPYNLNSNIVEKFINQKANWILSKINFFSNLTSSIPKATKRDYNNKKQEALDLVKRKISKFNQTYNFKFNKINIKNQKTRWGSCSKKGNLNFNYRIIYLTEGMINYIIVHELCHLKELNHSKRFWNLVEKTLPSYKEIKRNLKNKGL